MPHSWHFPTGRMLDWVWRLQPDSVLDIGAGYGKWGFLIRELLDWNVGNLDRVTWKARIDGIDVFPYRSPLHDWVYDSFRQVDVFETVDTLTDYSLVIMSDVIEHVPKDDALQLLHTLAERNRNILISTPLDYFTQEIADNPYERHVSHWAASDFADFVYDVDIAGGAALIVLLAGRGATTPTLWDRRVSRALDVLPYVRRHGTARRALKAAVTPRSAR